MSDPVSTTTADPLPGLSANALLKRAIANARDRNERKGTWHPRWVAIMDTFALGSTYATNLCLWAGLNPHEEVKR